jgi:glycyl-tRNA synthetase beta chain
VPDFLLELLSEEIPARMQAKAEGDLARLFTEQLAAAGLAAQAIETCSTPRRLALIARGLPLETAAVSEERKGPSANAPAQAIEGFLRSTGLTRDQLVEREDKKGVTLFAIVEKPGRATADVLAEAIPAIIRAFPWPKSMRWGAASASTESIRWVRPLQGIVALLGEDIVPLEIAGVQSGASTVGHRFHHPGVITIGGAHDYAEKLRACHVIVDPAERRRIIADGAKATADAAGLTLVEDKGLLAENAGLTEWPVPLLGGFDPAFLEVPREVIQLTMRTNQKYFACTNSSGELAPNFICTANIEAADGGAAIVAGSEKVLAARLSDAKFFWEQDLKIPLKDQANRLNQIIFHEQLGTIADKVERVRQLALWLVETDVIRPTEPGPQAATILYNQAQDAAVLAKADLVSGMVGEFPELQGVIGGYLARAQGQPDAVADAIRDHYKPIGQGDEAPTSAVTVAVSLADKLDTLACFFVAELLPTGSKDPFALRRAAMGVIELVAANGIRLGLMPALSQSMARVAGRVSGNEGASLFDDLVKARHAAGDPMLSEEFEKKRAQFIERATSPEELEKFSQRADQATAKLINFFADRLKVQQREAGVRHDLIDAVFALGGEDDLVRLLARVKALQAFVETPEGADLLAGYKRASNILKKEGWTGAEALVSPGSQGIPQTGEEDPLVLVEEPGIAEAIAEMAHHHPKKPLSYTPESEEAALIAALDVAEPRAAAAIEAEDFEGAMAALASLRAPVDAFFDKVTVNDPDQDKREARLALLARVRDAVHAVADFSKIEG